MPPDESILGNNIANKRIRSCTNLPLITVEKPGALGWMGYLALSLILNLGIYYLQNFLITFLLAAIINIVLVPVVWGKMTPWILRKNLFRRLETQGKEGPRLLALLLGISLTPSRTYFLEGHMTSVNLKKITLVFRQKIFDVISASVGLGFLLVLGLRYIFAAFFGAAINILGMAIVILFFMPLCLFWFVPLIWTLKDAEIRALDSQHNIKNLGDEIKGGILRKLLGVTAIITGVGFFADLGPEFWVGKPLGDSIIGIYLMSVVFVGILICSIGGVATLTCLIYLRWYHSGNINTCREELTRVMPIKYTQAIPSPPA